MISSSLSAAAAAFRRSHKVMRLPKVLHQIRPLSTQGCFSLPQPVKVPDRHDEKQPQRCSMYLTALGFFSVKKYCISQRTSFLSVDARLFISYFSHWDTDSKCPYMDPLSKSVNESLVWLLWSRNASKVTFCSLPYQRKPASVPAPAFNHV